MRLELPSRGILTPDRGAEVVVLSAIFTTQVALSGDTECHALYCTYVEMRGTFDRST